MPGGPWPFAEAEKIVSFQTVIETAVKKESDSLDRQSKGRRMAFGSRSAFYGQGIGTCWCFRGTPFRSAATGQGHEQEQGQRPNDLPRSPLRHDASSQEGKRESEDGIQQNQGIRTRSTWQT